MEAARRPAGAVPTTEGREPGRPAGDRPTTEALEFVRFCYHRRQIGWPELYDEMCAVAGKGLYQGWGAEELTAAGIGLSLFEMPGLAALAARVIAEEPAPSRARRSAGRENGAGPGTARGERAGAVAVEGPAESRPLRLVPRAL